MLVFLLEGAELLNPVLVIVVRAMAEVEAEHVGPGVEQGPQALGPGRGGAEGRHDLGEAVAMHEASLAPR